MRRKRKERSVSLRFPLRIHTQHLSLQLRPAYTARLAFYLTFSPAGLAFCGPRFPSPCTPRLSARSRSMSHNNISAFRRARASRSGVGKPRLSTCSFKVNLTCFGMQRLTSRPALPPSLAYLNNHPNPTQPNPNPNRDRGEHVWHLTLDGTRRANISSVDSASTFGTRWLPRPSFIVIIGRLPTLTLDISLFPSVSMVCPKISHHPHGY